MVETRWSAQPELLSPGWIQKFADYCPREITALNELWFSKKGRMWKLQVNVKICAKCSEWF